MDSDDRYKWVSADSILVGFGSGADNVKFDHVVEAVPENRRAIKAAYLVRGGNVRRVMRDVIKPRKVFKILGTTVRPAEVAVGLLIPDALPKDTRAAPTGSEKAIGAILVVVFDMDAAAADQLNALKKALDTYKTLTKKEADTRTEAAAHLQAHILAKKVSAKSHATTTQPGKATAAAATTTAAPHHALPPPPERRPAPRPPDGDPALAAVAASGADRPALAATTPSLGTGSVATPAAARGGNDPASRSLPLLSLTCPAGFLGAAAREADPGARHAPGEKPTRRRDCGRTPFKPGKGDADADSKKLSPAVLSLDKESRRELMSSVTAITIDSVVLPEKTAQAATLCEMASCLRGEDPKAVMGRVLAYGTSDEPASSSPGNARVIEMLRELRFLQLSMRSCVSLFVNAPVLPGVLADGIYCVEASMTGLWPIGEAGRKGQ